MGYGILAILFGLAVVIKVNMYGSIWIVLGVYIIYSKISTEKSAQSEMDVSSVDRSNYVVDGIGGAENIDINLSKYSYASQLIVLKDKSILIGYNNFETKKIINFDSIINLDIRINKAIKGTSYQHTTNYNKELIESIIVYIHTNECTEELIFRYSSYETDQAQIKYNEILKGLNRFKAMIDDTLDLDGLGNKSTIDIKEKSIPQQIKEYKELLDIDAITKEEFDKKKKQLLGI